MISFKKILCPTDFSEPSLEALLAASDLASMFSSKLVVLHVVAPVPSIPPGLGRTMTFNLNEYVTQLEGSALRKLKEIVGERVDPKIDVQIEVSSGNAADEIASTAREEKADLIVIATHGSSGWRRFVFGSVAEKVVRQISCPVLLIHPQAEKGD